MAALTEFPDRQLLGEDVVWFGDEDTRFLSSHRIILTAAYVGGAFGSASECKLTFRTIADTFCHENRVWDEWLIRDNTAIGVQLGQAAQDAAHASILSGDTQMPFVPATDIAGPYAGRGNDSE